jgi:HAD superfamily hydrolase (TIGR01509 family)
LDFTPGGNFTGSKYKVVKFSTIFWDNDGTLVDTEGPYFEATKTVLKKVGLTIEREWYIEKWIRNGKSTFAWVKEQGISEETIAQLQLERDDLYMAYLKTGKIPVMNGVFEVLQTLHGKIPMGIVTSSRPDHLAEIMKSTGLGVYFDFFITPEDVTHPKPFPDPYLLAWEKSGLEKNKCLVIEDNERGLRAAKAAGLTCFVVPNELSRENDLSDADRVLGQLTEVLLYL